MAPSRKTTVASVRRTRDQKLSVSKLGTTASEPARKVMQLTTPVPPTWNIGMVMR